VGPVRFGTSRGTEPRTVLEAFDRGWWYAAALPDGRAVAGLFTDADLLPGPAGRERLWAQAWAGACLVPDLVAFADRAPIHTAPAQTGAATACAGADWLAVGDAARTLDPLSGRGITEALTSALRAAEAVRAPAADRTAALAADAERAAEEHRLHLATRLTHYRRERRWPDSPFWRRRHAAPPDPARPPVPTI
jgi:flavin-dependent dehydrogenase